MLFNDASICCSLPAFVLQHLFSPQLFIELSKFSRFFKIINVFSPVDVRVK